MGVRLLCTFVLVSLLPASPAWAQGTAASPPPGQAARVEAPPVPEPPYFPSLDRIRRALAVRRPSPLTSSTVQRGTVFRMEIVETRFVQPEFVETLLPPWQPVQPGMLYHAEFLNRVNRPEVRPYAMFTGGELARVAASSVANHYMGVAVKKAVKEAVKSIKAEVRQVQLARLRRQIAEDIAAIERANQAAKNQESEKK